MEKVSFGALGAFVSFGELWLAFVIFEHGF
jgi:hypothetical protein